MPNFPASGLGENLLTLPYSGFVRKWGTPQNGVSNGKLMINLGVLYGQIHILYIYIYIYICYILYIYNIYYI